jgi:hypothetical protein
VSRRRSADIYITVLFRCNNNPGLFTGRALKRTWARMRSFLLVIGGSTPDCCKQVGRKVTQHSHARNAQHFLSAALRSRTLEVAPPDYCSRQFVYVTHTSEQIIGFQGCYSSKGRFMKELGGHLFRIWACSVFFTWAC